MWAKLAEQSDKEGWPAARFLAALAEHEIADRGRRRIERHLAEARLPVGKTLDSFEFEAVPIVSKAQVMALTSGDGWIEKGANLLLFGPPGGGKSHLAAAIGLALVENGWRVLFMRTSDLVQRLQIARRDLVLESALLEGEQDGVDLGAAAQRVEIGDPVFPTATSPSIRQERTPLSDATASVRRGKPR
jgi:DNA replication protein DnaC